jgi:hypothetical protein
LKGTLTDSPISICNAIRIALQEALQPAAKHGEIIVAVYSAVKATNSMGLVCLDNVKPTKFRFEVRIPHADDRDATLETLQMEAKSAGSRWLLPTLVEFLCDADRLSVRLTVENEPSGRTWKPTVIGLQPLA